MKRTIILTCALALATTPVFAVDKRIPAAAKSSPQCIVKLLDINNATEDQIKALPGIDEAYCKKIITGRPYSSIDQLRTKNIIPEDTYEKIKDRIVIKQVEKQEERL